MERHDPNVHYVDDDIFDRASSWFNGIERTEGVSGVLAGSASLRVFQRAAGIKAIEVGVSVDAYLRRSSSWPSWKVWRTSIFLEFYEPEIGKKSIPMSAPTATEEPERRQRKPDWLRAKPPTGESYRKVREIVSSTSLATPSVRAATVPTWVERWAGTSPRSPDPRATSAPGPGFLPVGYRRPDEEDLRTGPAWPVQWNHGVKYQSDHLRGPGMTSRMAGPYLARTIRAIRRASCPGTTMETRSLIWREMG